MNRQDILKAVINNIHRHRDYAESLRDKDLTIAMQNADFASLEKKRRELVLTIAEQEFSEQNSADTVKELEVVINKLNILSRKMNLSPYEAKYNCIKCRDSGTANGEMCECVKRMYYDSLRKLSNIDSLLPHTFKDHNEKLFSGVKQEEAMRKLYKGLKSLSESFPSLPYYNMVLSGGTGTGKTFALSAFGNAVIDRGYTTLFITAFDMHNAFLKYHISDTQSKSIHLENILDTELLIIDDLGTEPIFKNITLEYLYLVITERTKNHLTTFISTNLMPDKLLDRYGERIFSRLTDKRQSRLISIDGDDIRHRI